MLNSMTYLFSRLTRSWGITAEGVPGESPGGATDNDGRNDTGIRSDNDWVRAPPTFDYEQAVCQAACQADDWDDCVCDLRNRDDHRDVGRRRLFDDWDDVSSEASTNEEDSEQDERLEFVDEYLNGKAMEDLMGVMATVTIFLATLRGIVIIE